MLMPKLSWKNDVDGNVTEIETTNWQLLALCKTKEIKKDRILSRAVAWLIMMTIMCVKLKSSYIRRQFSHQPIFDHYTYRETLAGK